MWEIEGKLIDLTVHRFHLDDEVLPYLSDYKKSLIASNFVKFFTFGANIVVII